VIDEVRVLRRIENLEHRGGRVPRGASAGHLVNLVDHQHRIPYLDASQCLKDQSRHRSHVGASVTANLGLVSDAADGDAIERARDRQRDRFA